MPAQDPRPEPLEVGSATSPGPVGPVLTNVGEESYPSFIRGAREFEISGSTFASSNRDYYGGASYHSNSIVIHNHHGTQTAPTPRDDSVPTVDATPAATASLSPENTHVLPTPPQDPEGPVDLEIYNRFLGAKGRGFPLWFPEPNNRLPIEYQRKGVDIGDVGIITQFGNFDFLFNICLPQDHPINRNKVPEGFYPFEQCDIHEYEAYSVGTFLTSPSIASSRFEGINPNRSLAFESSAMEGAILTMPDGAEALQLENVLHFSQYMAQHVESWYKYVLHNRGRKVDNGEVRLVIGRDNSPSWGMAPFKNVSERNNLLKLIFKPVEDSNHSQKYSWDILSGTATIRTGPNLRKVERLRTSDNPDVVNQTLFVRTLNARLMDETWKELLSVTGYGASYAQGSQNAPASHGLWYTSPAAPSTHSTRGGQASSTGYIGYIVNREVSSSTGQRLKLSTSPEASKISHPSDEINKLVSQNLPDGLRVAEVKMIITQDADWISVLTENDTVLPPGNELYSRIRKSRTLIIDKEHGFVSFEPCPAVMDTLDPTVISGSSLLRFEHGEDLADISEEKSPNQIPVQLTPRGHADLPITLDGMGVILGIDLERTGDLDYISETISSQRKSVSLTSEDHADLPTHLVNLGISLHTRFRYTNNLVDIDEAISAQQKSVQLTPEGHPDLPDRLNSYGTSLRARFECTGEIGDLWEAISSQEKSIQLTPEGHSDLPARLHNYGVLLRARFECTGDISNIFKAVSFQRKAVQLTPVDHPGLPDRLNSLGISLHTRFERTGDLADLSEAVSLQRQSIVLTPDSHADMPSYLSSLGISLHARFERTGDLADLSEAVSLQQKSITLTPDSHARLPAQLDNLVCLFRIRFGRTEDLADISEAISLQQKSIQLTPEVDPNLPARLSNLGTSLQTRFQRIGDLSDIQEAISSQQKSVQLTPEGHVRLPAQLDSLSYSFGARFRHTGDPADISEAIILQKKSVQLTPEGHPDLPRRLNNLGASFLASFEHTEDDADVRSAIFHYRLSAISTLGPPAIRLAAAKEWARCAQSTDQSQLLGAFQVAVSLISQVAGQDQTVQNRYASLIDVSELSAAAAAAAIDFGQHSLAVEWLEQGRCLVWRQLNNLRAPIDDLRTANPVLADDIIRVSRALENANARAEPTIFSAEIDWKTKMSIQDEAHTHIKLAQEWDRLLLKVRAIPQFEDFLRPASCLTLLRTIPDSGHVVVINIHQTRCDALALTSGAEEPLHIALPEFTHEKADSLRRSLKTLLVSETPKSRRYMGGISDLLRQLWESVVKPILDGLGYSAPASEIPRIWWCVTGPLAFLPLHAAGIYTAPETLGIYSTLSDFAVSSYTPTVSSLVKRVNNSRETAHKKTGLLIIGQPDTPGLSPLPEVTAEIGAIKRLLAYQNIQHLALESHDATVDRVKASMHDHACVHFACHAAQDRSNPLKSSLNLYDGRLELSTIIKERLQGADLAFLSASETSAGDEKLSGEAVHLAGGMLAAGYRGVVATMWCISDRVGPKLAEEFYKHLLSQAAENKHSWEGLSSDGAAHALHYATQQVRKTLDGSELSLRTWVPFVHFGV